MIKNNNNRIAKRNYCFFAFVLLSGLLALRHPSMGIDLGYGKSYGYLGMYETIGFSGWNKVLNSDFLNYEHGYVIFCKLLSYISKDSQILLISVALISIASISYMIYKYSENCLLSYVIYLGMPVFLINYSGLRQTIAIAITVLSYSFIREKKFLKFVALVILASLFHKSAVIFLIAYPLYYSKNLSKYRRFTIIAIFLVYIFRNTLFAVCSKIFKQNAIPNNNQAVMLFLVLTGVYFFTVIFSAPTDEHIEGLKNLFFMACVCQAFGGVYSIALRVGYYFMIYLALLLPNVFASNKNEKDSVTKMIFVIVVFMCFATFGLYSIYNGEWAMSYPYYFVWEAI